MIQPYYIPEEMLRSLEGTALFYPHSGYDLRQPVAVFASWITDFWFADVAYFDIKNPADKAEYALAGLPQYKPLAYALNGPPVSPPGEQIRDIDPCVRTETYLHLASGKTFRVHRRRGYSASGFRVENFTLGAFFYRGDSSEGAAQRGFR